MNAKKYINPYEAFTYVYNGISRRIITPATVTEPYDPKIGLTPDTKQLGVNALWDTGATGSVVTKKTAIDLELIPIGSVFVNHAGGKSNSNTYLINIVLPNSVGIMGVTVTECEDIPGDINLLIGMDVISLGDLAITNFNNKTVVSFRIPSFGFTDYVNIANKIKYNGTKPFAPCPCGAKDHLGKPVSFHRCHGLSIVDKQK